MAESAIRESSITDYIEDYRDLSISYDTMHLKEKESSTLDSSGISEMVLLGDSFIQKYKGDLEDLVLSKTFNREESRKYLNNPWVLSYDLYGSVEFWFLLLELNGMSSAIEFTRKTIKVYDQSLPTVIDTIIAAEEDFINLNAAELDDTIANDTDDTSDISDE